MKKYENIALYLKKNIENGTFKEGDAIDSELALSKKFNVSRYTVRKAISKLENEGIIEKKQGKGNFVKHKGPLKIQGGVSFSSEIIKQGKTPSTNTVEIIIMDPDKLIKDKLKLTNGEKVINIKRIRYVDFEKVSFENEYYPYSLIPDINVSITNSSIYNYLESEKNIILNYAEQTIDIVKSDEMIFKYLGVEINNKILHVNILSFDQNGKPFNYGDAYYINNNFQLFMKVFNN